MQDDFDYDERYLDLGIQIDGLKTNDGVKMLLDQPGRFQFQVYDSQSKELQLLQEQTARPVDIIKEQLQKKFQSENDNRVYFLKAGTGAGKSTFFINELMSTLNGKNMICTKPKIKLAIDPMEELPLYFPQTFVRGQNLGFKVGGKEELPTQDGHVLFCTTQILANFIQQSSQQLWTYKYCVIDEVHDMSEQMLGLLYYIKSFLKENRTNQQCPIFIFMSATIDIEKFKIYFKTIDYKWTDFGVVLSQDRNYKIDKYYFGESENILERLEKCLEFINKHYQEKQIWTQKFKDILIFTKGQPTLDACSQACQKFDFKFPTVIFSFTARDLQDKTENLDKFNAAYAGKVKIIVSTTLLEAGANIPGLYCVIDTAIQQKEIYNNIQSRGGIQAIPISQSTIEQRQGRVGRYADGIYCGLYDENIQFQYSDENPFLYSKNILIFIFQFVRLILQFNPDAKKLDLQLLDIIEPINSDIIIVGYHKLIQLKLIYPDGTITEFFKYLLQHGGYSSLVKYLGLRYGCSAFEAALFLSFQVRTIKTKKFTEKDVLFKLLRNDFKGLPFNQVIDLYVQTYDILNEWKTYPNVEHSRDGLNKLCSALMEK